MDSLTTKIKITITATGQHTLDLSNAQDPLNKSYTIEMSSGTTSEKANELWHSKRTLAAAASETLDLFGVLSNAFRATVEFIVVKALIIANTSVVATGPKLILGDTGNTALAEMLGAANANRMVGPGDVRVFTAIGAGVAVAAGSTDSLKITHANDKPADLTYDIILIGTT